MVKSRKILTIPFLVFMGCMSNSTEPLPLPEEKLESVMLDVHVAESAMSLLQNGARKDSLANLYYDQIAEIHQIDRETLDSCLTFLQRNPELTEKMYEKLSEEIEKRQLEIK